MGGDRCRHRETSSAGWTAPALWLLPMATLPLLASSPRLASLGSACSNHVNLLVTSLSFWINCGPNPGDSLSYKKKKSFLFWLPGVRVWWVDFFFSLDFSSSYIATSGLHKDCRVCLHFNKYSIKMLWCVDFLVSWEPKHQRSFLGGRKLIIHCPLPLGWHRSPPPSARPMRSFFD